MRKVFPGRTVTDSFQAATGRAAAPLAEPRSSPARRARPRPWPVPLSAANMSADARPNPRAAAGDETDRLGETQGWFSVWVRLPTLAPEAAGRYRAGSTETGWGIIGRRVVPDAPRSIPGIQ